MNRESYRRCIESIVFGKCLPGALYIIHPCPDDVPSEFWVILRGGELAAKPDPQWNLLKVHTDQCALTFLTYPEFDSDPHPALAETTKINLNTGSIVRTNYRSRANPPILHRKETFLPPGDKRIPLFAALTKQEEAAGLYRDPSRIGLRVFWQGLLRRLELTHDGHSLVSVRQSDQCRFQVDHTADIARHRTAIKRYDLSKPVKMLLEHGLLRQNNSFFDYGCGHGMDVEALQNLGYDAAGWDPAFRPNAEKRLAMVVNCGYVLNVIEDPFERADVLRGAYSLTQSILIVSTLVAGQETDAHSRRYGDGFITKARTFQKFYSPGELEEFIENTLDVETSTLGLGICLVFRNAEDAENFEAGRNRRRIDWSEISSQLRFSVPTSRERCKVDRYELHKELYDQFWSRLIELGRTPHPGEFDKLSDIKKAAGTLNRAVALVVRHHSEELWRLARKARAEDVLVYLAMTKLRRRFLRRDIPLRTKYDIQAFFGDISNAQSQAKELLFAAGDAGEIELACEGLDVGWQDAESLTIHRSLLDRLPAVLRIYIFCAAHRYGNPRQADLIKIHKRSGKVTFQHYDDFDANSLPELTLRIKVNLRSLFVEVFDYSTAAKTQLLYFKERFVAKDYPGRRRMEKFSKKLRALGLSEESIGFGPDKETFTQLLRNVPQRTDQKQS